MKGQSAEVLDTGDLSYTERPANKPGFELAFICIVVVMFPASMSTVYGSIGAVVSAVVTAVALGGILRVRPSAGEIRSLVPWLFAALILLSTAVAAVTQQYSSSYIRGTPVQWSAFLSVWILAGLWQIRGGQPARYAAWLIGVCTVISLLGVWEYASKQYVEIDRLYTWITGFQFSDTAYRRSAESFRATGTLGNPLALGALSAVAGAGAIGFYLQSARFRWLLVFFVNSAATFATLSRSGWLALILSGVAMAAAWLVVNTPSWLTILLHLLAGIAFTAIILLYPPLQEALGSQLDQSWAVASSRVTELGDSFSYTHRVSTMSDAVDSMIDRPYGVLIGFGIGAENGFFLSNATTPVTGNAAKDIAFARTFDNTFLTITYCFGILGAGWFGWLIMTRFRPALTGEATGLWYAGMLATTVVCVCFFNAISMPSVSYVLAVLLGFRATPAPGRQ